MNDFTKEELENMLSIIDFEMHTQSLCNKIQSMIENYCDHHLINYCCRCDPENIVCDKCHRDLWGKSVE
jgi:hypothetical protein